MIDYLLRDLLGVVIVLVEEIIASSIDAVLRLGGLVWISCGKLLFPINIISSSLLSHVIFIVYDFI